MATTIQVTEQTKQLLNLLKQKEQKKSFDALLRELAEKRLQVPKSLFGTFPAMKKWNRKEDRMRFHDE